MVIGNEYLRTLTNSIGKQNLGEEISSLPFTTDLYSKLFVRQFQKTQAWDGQLVKNCLSVVHTLRSKSLKIGIQFGIATTK